MYYLLILLYDYRKFDISKNETKLTMIKTIKLLKYVQFPNIKYEILIKLKYSNIQTKKREKVQRYYFV